MTFNEISKKLIKNNYKRYMSFLFAIYFSSAMIGAFGILLFSPTVTSVLIAGGSTYIFALGMYFVTILGMVTFLIYANSVFLKYKVDEIGTLLSLGMKRNKVSQLIMREFSIVFSIGSCCGVAFAIPLAWFFWSLLSMSFQTYETAFHIGWQGIWIAGAFILFMFVMLVLINNWNIKKYDIMRILRSSAAIEEIKGDHYMLGLIGLLAIPFGLTMFNVAGETNYSGIFLAISILGLYLFTIQITSIGSIVKKISPKIYYRNILFFNLMKQKGKQYTLSLFISTILIAVCVFGICFNSSVFIDAYYQIQEEPFDGSILINSQYSTLDEHTIEQTAMYNKSQVTDMVSVDILLVGREYVYADYTKEWSYDFLISESDANLFLTEKIDILSGTCTPFDDSGMFKNFSTYYGKEAVFYNPTSKRDFALSLTSGIMGARTINRTKAISRFVIIDDMDFSNLRESIEQKYLYHYYLFNIYNLNDPASFQKQLIEMVISENGGLVNVNEFNCVVKDKYEQAGIEIKDNTIQYKGNELYVARWWDGFPFVRNMAVNNLLEEGAIYIMLMLFISIIAFVSASMIIGIKIMSTLWQDQTEYQKAVYLGLTERALKRLKTKQIATIYLFPTICGCTTAVFLIYNIMSVSSVKNVIEVTIVAILLSLCIAFIQFVVFYFIRRRIVSSK